MGVRSYLANWFIGTGRAIGRKTGLEMAVELSDHSIEAAMVNPERDDMAWDDRMYKHGNVFVAGYANPVKVRVNVGEKLEDPDTVELEESDAERFVHAEEELEEADESHTELISSGRYRDYMRQDLISQLLNPREQWRLLAYGIIAVGVLQLMSWAIILWATGSF